MRKWILSILICILLAVIVYPSAAIYPFDTLPDRNDTRLITYIIGQVQENILSGNELFYGRFFAPDKNTLAYSDPFITTSLLTLPLKIFTNSPIAVFNSGFIINFALTILCAYIFFMQIIKDTTSSLIATALFAFSGFHLHYYAHLQMFSFWIPFLALTFFHKYQQTNKNYYLILFLGISTLQLAESIFGFYLIFFASSFMFWRRTGQVRKIILHTLLIAPLWLVLVSPYIDLHQRFPEAIRPIRDAAHFSLGLDQIFTFYHSWVTITIALVSFLLYKFLIKKNSENKTIWVSMLLFGVIMSLGPVLKILGQNIKLFGLPLPLPYTLFYYFFPGFTGFRTPSRFIILALLALAVIVGLQMKNFTIHLQNKTKIIFVGLIFSLLALEADLPLKGYPVNINMHPVYLKVAKLPPEVIILELPIKLWNMPEHEIESVRSLYSLTHKHRRFGGYSGFATNDWINLVEDINSNGLNDKNTQTLKQLGVSHIIENNTVRRLD